MTASPPRWMRCLEQTGTRIFPCAGRAGGFGVYPHNDRRRRPLAKLTREVLKQALADGSVEADEQGVVLSEAGRQALVRYRSRGDGFDSQHQNLTDRPVTLSSGQITVARANLLESPLSRWSRFIEPVELEAGERLRTDFAVSTLHQQTTFNWAMAGIPSSSGNSGRSPDNASLSAIAAKDRVMNALHAVGTGLDTVLTSVCIREESMAAIERRYGWAQRSGKTILKLALRRLAEHYGMVRKSSPQA
jgi:hypothetical protein